MIIRKLRISLGVAVLLATLAQGAELDYSAGFGARSLPIGAAAFGSLGYDQMLWGERAPGQYFYGFVRPAANIRVSGVVNRAELRLEVYPVSFFKLSAGYARSYRFLNQADDVDCSQYYCQGNVGGPFGAANLVLGYHGFAMSLTSQISGVSASSTAQDVYDETSNLIAQGSGDTLIFNEEILAWSFAPAWKAGLLFTQGHMIQSLSSNNLESVIASYESRNWAYLGGIGTYESSIQSRGPTIFTMIRWAGLPSFGPH